MRFQRPTEGAVRLSNDVVDRLQSHAQRHRWSPEAGGILLGRLMKDGGNIVVDDLTTPCPQDRRSRFRFFRAVTPAQVAVNDAWQRSSGELNYLGEWHTHPEDVPEPSSHDQRNWKRLVTTALFEQESLLFMIVGRERIRAWELMRGQKIATPLSIVVD